MDTKYEFIGKPLVFDQGFSTAEFDIPDDFQLVGITGTATPMAVWVRIASETGTQLEFDMNGAVGDASDFPE